MPIIEIKIIPNARKNSIEKDGSVYKVHVMAPAVDGKANKALVEYLSDYFKVKKSNIEIVKGEKSRNKKVNIIGEIDLR